MAKKRRKRHRQTIRSVLANNIRELVDDSDITLDQLAEKAGVSRSHLMRVMAMASSPSIDWVQKIADAFDVDIAALVWRAS